MDCGKKAVKKRTVVEEERAKLFRDSEDTMAVSAGKELKRHRSGTVDGIHVAAGRAEWCGIKKVDSLFSRIS